MEALRLRLQKPKKPASRSEPNFNSDEWEWRRFIADGQILAGPPLRVTQRTYERALAIFNSLLFAAEARGITVDHEKQSSQLSLQLYGCNGQARFTERLTDAPRDRSKETPLERVLGKDTTKVSSGMLRIYFSARGYSESAFSESADQPLEANLNDFFRRFYKAVVRERAAKRREAERQRLYQEETKRRAEAAAIRQQEERQHEQENERRKTLLAEAGAWRNASLVRAYASHIEQTLARLDGPAQLEIKGWLMWAERVADEMDPTPNQISSGND